MTCSHKCWRVRSILLGPKVAEFEKKIADYHNVSSAIGVASGTDALHLSIDALGVGEGDEVITTPFTFFATAEAILYTGAIPVFVDIEPETLNMDVSLIEKRLLQEQRLLSLCIYSGILLIWMQFRK